ncbi:hypothetical protein GIB67_006473 [Kingdonia uniflora]|uniref:ABC transmembrane type-1 domain-containing protein n=1 Tax=Kingdonia uniflora TaxID=39325 RepID=A0A7J7LEN5_9MAGN|nr:hypothetical protein GIB67_006473 [Kingdonia uniflora]
MSFQRSISQESSGAGNSTYHSFSPPFGIPSLSEPKAQHDIPLEKEKDAPISWLIHLNKPKIPDILLGVVFAAINGVVHPIFGVLQSGVINSFYEPPSELGKDSKVWALSGEIGMRLLADTTKVRGLVGDPLAFVIQNLAAAVAAVIIAFTASLELTLIILVLLPLVGANGYVQLKFNEGFNADAKLHAKFHRNQIRLWGRKGPVRFVSSFNVSFWNLTIYLVAILRRNLGPILPMTKIALMLGHQGPQVMGYLQGRVMSSPRPREGYGTLPRNAGQFSKESLIWRRYAPRATRDALPLTDGQYK